MPKKRNYRKKIQFLAIVIGFIFSYSCKKNRPTDFSNFEVIDTKKTYDIRKVFFQNDYIGYAVGGWRDENGFILKTTDKGENWEEIYNEPQRNIYDIYFINDSVGVAGGEFLLWLYTFDAGKTWTKHWFYKDIPINEQDRPAIKNIKQLNDSTLVFVGGEDYGTGVIFKMYHIFKDWDFEQLSNQLTGLSIKNKEIITSGFGFIGKYNTDLKQFKHPSDNFVAIHNFDTKEYITAGNKGKFYKSYNQGGKWKSVESKPRFSKNNWQINDMIFINETEGIAVGNYGLLLYSNDKGESWSEFRLPKKQVLYSISNVKKKLYIAAKEGKIYTFSVQDLMVQ